MFMFSKGGYIAVIVIGAILFSIGVASLLGILILERKTRYKEPEIIGAIIACALMIAIGCSNVVLQTIDYNDSYAKECNIYSNNENTIYENTDDFVVKKRSELALFVWRYFYDIKIVDIEHATYLPKTLPKDKTTIFYIENYQEPTLIERKAHKGGISYELYVPLDTIWIGSFENE